MFGVLAACVAHAADDPQAPGDFMLGGSFKAAQQHALEQDWKLVSLSEGLPHQWIVEGSSVSLVVCDGIVVSISERLEGDLEEFAALVFSMQAEFGKPDVQILSFRSGIGKISTIDARFDTDHGEANVQLQSIGGERTFSVNHRIDTECH